MESTLLGIIKDTNMSQASNLKAFKVVPIGLYSKIQLSQENVKVYIKGKYSQKLLKKC